MSLKEIASKQKRLKDWSNWMQQETQDLRIKQLTAETLKDYSDLLFRCWELGELSQLDSAKLENLERVLQQLNEEARLRVVPQWTKASS